MIQLSIKPFSVNEAWKGRRSKTEKYRDYEYDVYRMLPAYLHIPEGKLQAHYLFGVSTALADNDNPVKPFQDILQKKYGFNDNRIFRTIADKVIVPKGREFIYCKIAPLGTSFPEVVHNIDSLL